MASIMDEHLVDVWRSQRLVYRSIYPQDSTWMRENISSDAINVTLSAPTLLRPPRKETDDEWYSSMFKDALLSVMLCLPGDEPAATVADETAGGKEKETDGKKQKPEPTPIGILVLSGHPPVFQQHRKTELGITLAEPYQNNGYGAEAINWALDWAFLYGNLNRVNIGTVEYNVRAQKVYERIGFVKEGCSRQSLWSRGRYWDQISYGMLRSEWEAIRKAQLETGNPA